MKLRISLFAAAATLAMTSTAFALPATVTVDLPLRSGPGPMHTIIATLDHNAIVEVEGCIETGTWCQVATNGQRGWVWGANLSAQAQGQTVIVSAQR